MCAHQYDDLHEKARNALTKMDSSKWTEISFEDLLADPKAVIKGLCEFIEIKYSPAMQVIVKEMPKVNET
jgi:LPS sulfotransferase NodH